MEVYNTLTKRLEKFEPLEQGHVRMYNCGPTVYDHPHIGNFRAFVFADVLRRYFEFLGDKVSQVMNLTDVGHLTYEAEERGEDRIEAAARRLKTDPWQIAEIYIKEFLEYVDTLNFRRALVYPRATQHIPEMIALIQKLIERNFAYVTPNGNVYFEVAKFHDYAKLSGNPVEELEPGARITVNPEKRSPLDFALWKQNPNHVMQWDSPWGKGFPGWHIECSAMSMKYLGEEFDIHTGGEDNIFPHHDCEIAQSVCGTGRRFVKYWMHCRHLMVDGKKMSKSLGNFFTVADILGKGFEPIVLRFYLLSAHYRTSMNFTMTGLEQAKSSVERLREVKAKLSEVVKANPKGADVGKAVNMLTKRAKDDFTKAMDADLNVAAGLAVVFEYIRAVNKFLNDAALSAQTAENLLGLLLEFDDVIGVLKVEKEQNLDGESQKMIAEREKARKRRDFGTADKIRNELRSRGVLLQDTKNGTRWRKI